MRNSYVVQLAQAMGQTDSKEQITYDITTYHNDSTRKSSTSRIEDKAETVTIRRSFFKGRVGEENGRRKSPEQQRQQRKRQSSAPSLKTSMMSNGLMTNTATSESSSSQMKSVQQLYSQGNNVTMESVASAVAAGERTILSLLLCTCYAFVDVLI